MANTIKEIKAEALKRRMREMNLGEAEVARRCSLTSRDAVSRWRAGSNWPYPSGEEKLEDVLQVPPGFFTRIAAGQSYEDALKVTQAEQEDAAFTVRLTEALLQLEPLNSLQAEEVRAHLKNQIRLLFKLAFPGIEPTPEGIRRIRIQLEEENRNYMREEKLQIKKNKS